jgi:exosortase E/protease (VPEID-CTERM system)
LAQFVPLRVWLLFAILAAELEPLALLPHTWRHSVLFGGPLIVFGVSLLFFGWRRLAATQITDRMIPTRIDLRFLGTHALTLALLAGSEFALLHSSNMEAGTEATVVWLRFLAILAVIASLIAAFLTLPVLAKVLRSLGVAWAYAALCTLLMIGYRWLTNDTWGVSGSRFGSAMQIACFSGTRRLLSLFYKHVVYNPSALTLGTDKFSVTVSAPCSGIEGLGLMLAFAVCGLIFARRELRLARAALLIPVALVTMWLLNMVRIAALIAIGDTGHEEVAINGFHSEAGWIIFNAVAICFLVAAHRMRWLQKDSFVQTRVAVESQRNLAAIYLLPFLAVLAASMIGRAASSGFDWLYPLRLAVAAGVLWWFRAEYRKLDWRFDWLGPLAGAAIFALWLGLAHWQGGGARDELALQLARLTAGQRIAWLAVRALAAVVTVPIAEELAFRGYIARRILSADVESVPYGRLSVLAILVSSLAFGALHGRMWIAGTIAGIVFAGVAKLRGRLGEAIAAHATANLLIAIWVLTRGDFRMW